MRAFEVGVIPEPLQNLNEDQISDREKFLAEQPVEFVRLRRHRAIEVVDPDARINQNQSSVLIASRSPSQRSLPRNFRISASLLRRTSIRRPRSTASFFVLAPLTRKASRINLSSITILVRVDVYALCRL